MTIHIRQGVPDDLPALQSFDEWDVVSQRRIDDGHLYAAHDDHGLRAYGILDRSFFNRAFVAIVFVDPEYRQLGFGEALLAHFETVTTDEKLWISTNIENGAMQRLLHKRGYEMSGVVNNLGRVPELVYMKRVNDPGASATS